MGEKRKGPSPSCLCGECRKCKKREYDRARAADPVIQARRIAQAQAWREANRERYEANQRAWREQTHSERTASKALYYRENKERELAKAAKKYREDRAPAKARARRHYYANKEDMVAKSVAWARRNPERARRVKRRRNLVERGVDRTPENDLMLEVLQSDPCCYCGAPSEHIDHIIPVARGGTGGWGNLTAACRRCNQSKNATPLLLWMADRVLLDA